MQKLLDLISSSISLLTPIEIDCKNAGTVLRFLTAYLSVTPGNWLVTGDERLSIRPIEDLVDALKNLGADISYQHKPGQLPIMIRGKPLFSQSYAKLNMQKSSQFASALMLMISKFPNGLQIDFENEIISKPYFGMTAQILEQCGVEIKRSEKNIILKGIPKCSTEIFIESDWTAASYFYAFVALSENGTVEMKNLQKDSLQGDSILPYLFEKLGVETTFASDKVVVKKVSQPLCSRLDLDLSDYPDIAQTLAVTCVALNIPAKLTGLSSLRHKETDRLQALSQELNQIGAENIIEQDSLILYKYNKLIFSKPIKTYGDHRMAMAFSIFSGLYDGVEIQHPEVVNKSFPNFWIQINNLKTNYHE
jgi:3-phosphoshikimate 1-carboxyvinyltransferase